MHNFIVKTSLRQTPSYFTVFEKKTLEFKFQCKRKKEQNYFHHKEYISAKNKTSYLTAPVTTLLRVSRVQIFKNFAAYKSPYPETSKS